ncbi:Maf family protein [Hyphomicrobium sp.]|uniref:Maf family protein n=1 Tax=Hyphomicrobium sp. TaxID=82 RepID=UPI002E2F0F3B|nr:Maf family protein [Hyphomicrobium sp.]HEX2840670.1 Maf family protein [Hyphomicrobium sp.]
MTNEGGRLILASGSATRRALLEAAGIAIWIYPADVDEAAIRDALLTENSHVSHESIAQTLADEKAKAVSALEPGAVVIGADQVLSFEGRLFEKPKSLSEARDCLLALRGKTHALHSAVALSKNGNVEWRNVETARLTMRNFSETALDRYLDHAGDEVLSSVGAYQIEGPAVQLFEAIDGDHATILGLPLLPLLAELRRREVLES